MSLQQFEYLVVSHSWLHAPNCSSRSCNPVIVRLIARRPVRIRSRKHAGKEGECGEGESGSFHARKIPEHLGAGQSMPEARKSASTQNAGHWPSPDQDINRSLTFAGTLGQSN